jgi:hypothetical protein
MTLYYIELCFIALYFFDFLLITIYTFRIETKRNGCNHVLVAIFNKKNSFKLLFIVTFLSDLIYAYVSHPEPTLRYSRVFRAVILVTFSKDLRRNLLGTNPYVTDRYHEIPQATNHLISVLLRHHRRMGLHWQQPLPAHPDS